MLTWASSLIHERPDQLTERVVDRQLHLAGLRKTVNDLRLRVEGVGVILSEMISPIGGQSITLPKGRGDSLRGSRYPLSPSHANRATGSTSTGSCDACSPPDVADSPLASHPVLWYFHAVSRFRVVEGVALNMRISSGRP
jgi:hypothetical protein